MPAGILKCGLSGSFFTKTVLFWRFRFSGSDSTLKSRSGGLKSGFLRAVFWKSCSKRVCIHLAASSRTCFFRSSTREQNRVAGNERVAAGMRPHIPRAYFGISKENRHVLRPEAGCLRDHLPDNGLRPLPLIGATGDDGKLGIIINLEDYSLGVGQIDPCAATPRA